MSIFLVLVSLPSISQVKDGTVYSWDATIGKQTKASIWFEKRDSVVVGEITYTKTNKPIKLRGILTKEDGYRLLEFESSGNVTGIITGNFKDSSFSGDWLSPKTRKELSLVLKLKSSFVAPKAVTSIPKVYDGTYRYGYSKDGPQGYLAVKRINANTAQIEFQNHTAAPAYNQATVDSVKVPINNNQIIYKLETNCVFRIRFYNDIAVVDYVNEQYECGFGMNATVDGVYLRGKK